MSKKHKTNKDMWDIQASEQKRIMTNSPMINSKNNNSGEEISNSPMVKSMNNGNSVHSEYQKNPRSTTIEQRYQSVKNDFSLKFKHHKATNRIIIDDNIAPINVKMNIDDVNIYDEMSYSESDIRSHTAALFLYMMTKRYPSAIMNVSGVKKFFENKELQRQYTDGKLYVFSYNDYISFYIVSDDFCNFSKELLKNPTLKNLKAIIACCKEATRDNNIASYWSGDVLNELNSRDRIEYVINYINEHSRITNSPKDVMTSLGVINYEKVALSGGTIFSEMIHTHDDDVDEIGISSAVDYSDSDIDEDTSTGETETEEDDDPFAMLDTLDDDLGDKLKSYVNEHATSEKEDDDNDLVIPVIRRPR